MRRTIQAPSKEVGSTEEGGSHPTRRRFLAGVGGGSAAIVGLSGPVGARETTTVSMGDNYFDPVGLHVEPGTTVRFEIESGSHSATAYQDRIPEGARPFDSGTISEGAFEHTFETPGTYDLFCRPHRSMGMVGRIVVDEPGGPAEASPIPDGDVPDSDDIVDRGAIGIDEFEEPDGTRPGMIGGGPGMMDGGPEMMDGSGHGWMVLMPLGFLTAFLGLVGGTVYWAVRRARSHGAGQPRARPVRLLEERYARGEIDRAEFERRRDRLESDDADSG